ncbi:YbhB/YbcL family Raf kinase inhibitor-like protein [Tropicibacter naphthalenivorans]|uniref:Putative kinase inhibitor n=1 Tax=Tropicibacter naphthalenivorans TaxID=441103 RepID=A0A0P1GM81_9RHOB|nr:YbhB/YbcL family Raf kinase inhibitor-like protein [Tropicibacter naphthalenivorans]CUH76923.1 putative kinase inhibitor [Tropicibacter naphthalenivorans]SMC62242.1 hypothetical protein SAMN04488093_102424 [Tropicibacter naphthalenivorans]
MLRTCFVAGLCFAAVSAQAFELTSPDIADGGDIAMKHVADVFGCTGENVSPALEWSGVPEGTGALALMVHDPDAPTGGAGFWHWIAVNIPANSTGITQGAAMPEGVTVRANDYGAEGWGGPCPPAGDPHRYVFTLYALPEALDVSGAPSKAVVGFMVNANATATASLTGMFGH